MSGEIYHSYDSAATLYALVYRPADSYIYDVGDTAFEAVGTWNDARVAECDIALTAAGDVHFGDFPSVAAGVYYVSVREQAGGSPDTDDRPVAQGVMHWDSSAEMNISTLDTLVDTVDTVVDTILVDTNETQTKLPTNYIMGSSDQTDKDDDIDAILVDTGTTIPATIVTAQNDLDILTGTNGVLIDDNAITSAKYDESTAFPVKSDDSGSTQIARVGADGDTLETLSDEIDAIATSTSTTIVNHLTDIKGTGFVKDTDSLVDLAHTGADSDTLETLSDQLDDVEVGVGNTVINDDEDVNTTVIS